MVAELQVQRLPMDDTDELVCALCARPFVPSPNVEMAYAGRVPIGAVCPNCLAHPAQAAEAARERAQEFRRIARDSEQGLSRQAWIRLLQIAQSRSDYWEGLAGRIERSLPWQVRTDLSGNQALTAASF